MNRIAAVATAAITAGLSIAAVGAMAVSQGVFDSTGGDTGPSTAAVVDAGTAPADARYRDDDHEKHERRDDDRYEWEHGDDD